LNQHFDEFVCNVWHDGFLRREIFIRRLDASLTATGRRKF
jgi:hypothetical protein